MSENSPILNLPYIQPAQAQKHVTHNEAISALEMAIQLTLRSHVEAVPPSAPARGDRYVVPAGGAQNWNATDGDVAVWDGIGWNFFGPKEGWLAYSEANQSFLKFDGTVWDDLGLGDQVEVIGVNATADPINRLSVSSEASLFNNDGSGHQMKVNKAAATDTASLLFQTGFSGRAEMGTSGTDDFAIKVSDDGTSWTTAMQFDAMSGVASGGAVQSSAADTTAGKLARVEYTYGPQTCLGTVSQTGGVPTGALIERGSNANGEYVRFADGTQICWSPQFVENVDTAIGALFRSSPVTWTYPASFSTFPALLQGRQNNATGYWTVLGQSWRTNATACAMSYEAVDGRIINFGAIGRWF